MKNAHPILKLGVKLYSYFLLGMLALIVLSFVFSYAGEQNLAGWAILWISAPPWWLASLLGMKTRMLEPLWFAVFLVGYFLIWMLLAAVWWLLVNVGADSD